MFENWVEKDIIIRSTAYNFVLLLAQVMDDQNVIVKSLIY